MTLRASGATGIGSLPGEDVREWCRIVAGELPVVPHLPELPQRGPGAEMIGRTLALAVQVDAGFAAETTVSGWRIAPRLSGTTAVLRRAASWLREDLDAAEETWSTHNGWFKIQVAGPLTLAAAVESSVGERLVADTGAVREVGGVLAEALVAHVREVRSRLPRVGLIVQVDEPAAGLVLAGEIPNQSGWSRLPPVSIPEARAVLGEVIDAIGSSGAGSVFHCCGSQAPVELFSRAGAAAVGVDLTLPQSDEDLGVLLESGIGLFAGLDSAREDGSMLSPLRELLGRLGIEPAAVVDRVVLTPRCGLAGVGMDEARQQYARVASAADEFGRKL